MKSAAASLTDPPQAPLQRGSRFSRDQWWALTGYYGFIGALHLLGWGAYLYYAAHEPALIGLGFAAYGLGLRHAFDADHIAAVDDTVRLMLQRGAQPLGVGFWFSLGHSTIVLALALTVGFAANAVKAHVPALQQFGAVIGAAVSGSFLWLVGLLNVLVLVGMMRTWRRADTSASHDHMEHLLQRRGLLNRLFQGRLGRSITHSWHMYPLGLLFGLGFDTASEIALLAMTAGAAAGDLPLAGTLSLPVLFAAGMSLMDTTDGVLMVKAYAWAFINPLRKIYYNITTTALSVIIALSIGSIELLQVAAHLLHIEHGVMAQIGDIDFGSLGYAIVAGFVGLWCISVLWWRLRHPNTGVEELSVHLHSHDDGSVHSHRHFDTK